MKLFPTEIVWRIFVLFNQLRIDAEKANSK
jgi:hypothetical protein